MAFVPHRIEWTREKAARVWDWVSKSAAHRNAYFSKQVGDSVITHADRLVRLRGRQVLDYGCGPGYLLEKLVARQIDARGVDFSAASIEEATQRIGVRQHFLGAVVAQSLPVPIASASHDVVFFCDIIEHLLAGDLDATVDDVKRILRPGGHVIITTNNEEHLEADDQLCPECGCIFHRVQHVTSWNVSSLTAFMDRHGFDRLHCEALIFRPPSRWNPLIELGSRYVLKTKPFNLIYIGTKGREG